MGMILDDSVIREIEAANNATDSKEEDYHLQIARWLKDYKRLLKQEPYEDVTDIDVGKMPCEDAISRSDILERCQLVIGQGLSDKNGYHMISAETIMYVVKQLPPVTPQPKTGHWIYDKKTDLAVCSKCGSYCPHDGLGRIETHFCPNCGAKMIEPQESEVNNG